MLRRFHLAFFFVCFLIPFCDSLNSDGLALLALKAAVESDPSGVLTSWSDSDTSPCRWTGVLCTHDRVTQLFLHNRALNGYLPSELGLLTSLKRLTLSHNYFSGLIPSHLFNATDLVVLDLSHNSLSGPIPTQIKSLKSLRHLDLSANFLNGSLPEYLTELISLVGTLNLSFNGFTGEVPVSYGRFPVMVSLDLQNNNLTGKIPQVGSLVNQGPTAFSGNPGLCGFPLQTRCPERENQKPEYFNSTRDPQDPNLTLPGEAVEPDREKSQGGGFVTVPLISGISLIVGAVSLSVWLLRRKKSSTEGKLGKENFTGEAEYMGEGQKSKFVVLDEGLNLELEDLLRASAYVLGKSRSGIVYRVVAVGRGSCATPSVVAVRRLSDGDTTWKLKEFQSEVEIIGRVQHPNIVRLRAYYYAHDEKLLVSDYVRNGSLHTALHGGPSSALPPLTWTVRLRIIQGTARGLTYIHEFSPRKYVHGNIKSTKILLDEDLQPFISGFGLTRLGLGTAKFSAAASKRYHSTNQSTIVTSTMGSKVTNHSINYLAPELRIPSGKYTQKCDVYSFGIVLLEILTGKLPGSGADDDDDGKALEGFVRKAFREERPLSEIIDSALLHEVHAKKQVIAAFHIALNCTEHDPELRPRMKTVSDSLDRIMSQ